MTRRKNALLDTALACVERDIPVQAATIAGTPDDGWITDVDAARVVWTSPSHRTWRSRRARPWQSGAYRGSPALTASGCMSRIDLGSGRRR
jgi:hypothetical protein